jgi:hypothetical protein
LAEKSYKQALLTRDEARRIAAASLAKYNRAVLLVMLVEYDAQIRV